MNVAATLRALEFSLARVDVAACKFFTDATLPGGHHPAISIVPIPPIRSSQAYSDFLLSGVVDHVGTSHCLVTQWDGHILDAARWRADFLDYDYIGASWPHFNDGHDVGNGGFSLRSRRLMEACRNPAFRSGHPEDVAIGRTNRERLEAEGMHFAPRELADLFSTERAGDLSRSFGFHGTWLMPRALGVATFWDIYRDLDDRGTIRHDFPLILRQMANGRGAMSRVLRLLADQLFPKDGR